MNIEIFDGAKWEPLEGTCTDKLRAKLREEKACSAHRLTDDTWDDCEPGEGAYDVRLA